MRRLLARLHHWRRNHWTRGLTQDLAGPPNRHRLGLDTPGRRARDNEAADPTHLARGDDW